MTRRYCIGLIVLVSLAVVGCSQTQPMTLRVMTYNIHHAEGLDKELSVERIAGIIKEAQPDLVAVQEADKGVKRSGGIDEAAKLAELTGMMVVFEKNIDLQGGDYGNAVLSRLPIESHEYYRLPRLGNNEQRGMIETHVKTKAGELVFIATHVDHQADDAERMASVAFIRQKVEQIKDRPIILAGDFNTTPETRVVAAIGEFLTNACSGEAALEPTFRADKPDRRIDYIFYNQYPGLRSTGCRVIPQAVASDHRPVVADFVLGK